MSAKKGLGRGFDSLVPRGTSVDIVVTPKTEKIHHLAIDVVRPKPDQPRQHFDDQLMAQLAQSIKEQGILQPIVVAEIEHNIYSIIAGERRWRGAKMAGLDRVPAIIKQVDELQHLELALLENIQRSDLNAIETAKTINRLHTEFGQSYEDIAIRLGKAYTTVVNSVRLLQLPEHMQQALMKSDISEGHGRAILSLTKHPHAQELLYSAIIIKKLSVRQAEALASSVKAQAEQQKISKKSNKTTQKFNDLSQTISSHLGVNVVVPKSDKKGKITLSYESKDEFDRIVHYLQR